VTHKYSRLSRLSTVLGISSYKWFLERPSTLSFPSLPIFVVIGPVMLLFCRALQDGGNKEKPSNQKGTPNRE
jgi:hypothetical protein